MRFSDLYAVRPSIIFLRNIIPNYTYYNNENLKQEDFYYTKCNVPRNKTLYILFMIGLYNLQA